MKAKRFLFFFITISFASSCSQVKHYDSQLNNHSISNVYIPFSGDINSKENKDLITNLELMGKLWGFLKYHHPAVGKGNWDWDHELFGILPEYLKVTRIWGSQGKICKLLYFRPERQNDHIQNPV